eukprot:jgi/Picre1/36013/NNA_003470.t1
MRSSKSRHTSAGCRLPSRLLSCHSHDILWETKRHDRWQLFAHHVATVILIGYSYYLHLLHIGVLVLACHEMNDIFLEAAKMARYAKAPEWMSVSWFIMFALSWFATRIYAFGFIVIRSTLTDTYERAKQVGESISSHMYPS